MFRIIMKSKIHRATVTGCNIHYVGSITIDEELMEAADIYPHEKVQVVDVDNGARLETYVIAGTRGSGIVALNGAAARLVQPGDRIIVITYALMQEQEARAHQPRVVLVDEHNRVARVTAGEVHGSLAPPLIP